MPTLFDPLQIGDLTLPNRILMAPLTRLRGTPDHLPTRVMVDYYRQRATAGLIVTEGTPVDPMGVGYANVPGIWSDEQTELWKPVTEAVHAGGGLIFCQIWHVGRVSDPVFLHGKLPVAPSPIAPPGHVSLIRPLQPFVAPRELSTEEVGEVVAAFRRGAQNARTAGFDGVEIHGANGYLLDQFLQDSTNHRTDAYGGSIERRARLMLEVADAAAEVFGPGRVGMHLAPRADAHGMGDSDLPATFGYVARELGRRKLGFLMAREHEGEDWLGPQLKEQFQATGGGAYVANEAFTQETAEAALARGDADAIAFGKQFISNPDLVERLRRGAPLNDPRPDLFYSPGPEGYIDYPALP